MNRHFIYGLCCLILLSYVGKKVWQDFSHSPHQIMDVSIASKQNLTGKGIVVAVIDEGFDSTHLKLKNQFSSYRYNTSNKTRDVSETVIFDEGKYGFESHGTHVVGIVSGLSPQAEIIPIKVDGFEGDQVFVKALQIATSSAARIVNISMRLSHTNREISPNVQNALIQLAQSGKLIVVAAGNEGKPMMSQAYTASLVELSLHPFVQGRLLLVGASTYRNGEETLAKFSNYPGKNKYGLRQTYFIIAPGENILSTITGGHFGEKSGTSMAAPMVVGVASLLSEAAPNLQAEDISHILLNSARKVSLNGKQLPSSYFGAGIVNLRAALVEIDKK